MLIVKATMEECPVKFYGEHKWVGHGDPSYMWCWNCGQEKKTNKEFIAWDTELKAQTVVSADRVVYEAFEYEGQLVHSVNKK